MSFAENLAAVHGVLGLGEELAAPAAIAAAMEFMGWAPGSAATPTHLLTNALVAAADGALFGRAKPTTLSTGARCGHGRGSADPVV